MPWNKFNPNILGKVIHPFHENVPYSLNLSLGDTVIIKSSFEDWYYGYSILKATSKSTLGIFPCSYVKIIGEEENNLENMEATGCTMDALKSKLLNVIIIQTSMWVSEINAVHKVDDMEKFKEIEIHENKLLELFYEIVNWSVDKKKLLKLLNQVKIQTNKMNKFLNYETIIPTKDLSILHVADYFLKCFNQLDQEDLLNTNEKNSIFSKTKSDSSEFNNLQIIVEHIEFPGNSDDLILEWNIIDTVKELCFEPFWQPVPEVKQKSTSWIREKFIFKKLPGEIKKDSMFLVIYVYRVGQLLPDLVKTKTSKFRRPIAFGSFCLQEIPSENDSITINLFNLNEAEFLKPTTEILKTKFISQTPIRFVQISAGIFNKNNPSLSGFEEDHILENVYLGNEIPCENNRHCIYLRLESAEFDRANKSAGKNVEAEISIKNFNGLKQKCILLNPDKTNETEYRSSVTYHCNSPRWRNLVKINLHIINLVDCHLLIDFYHCSSKEKKANERRHYGSCFLLLTELFECGSSSKCFTLGLQKISSVIRQFPRKYLSQTSMMSIDQEKGTLKEYCQISLILCSTYLSKNRDINEFLLCTSHEELSMQDLRTHLKNVQLITNEDFLKPKLRNAIVDVIKAYTVSKFSILNESVLEEYFITWQSLSQKYVAFGLTGELQTHLEGKFEFVDALLKGMKCALRDGWSGNLFFDTLTTVIKNCYPVFMVLSTYSDLEYQFQISERIKEIFEWNIILLNEYHNPDTSKDIRKLVFTFTTDNLKSILNLISMDVLIDYFKQIFDSAKFSDETILPAEKLDFINMLLKLIIPTKLTEVLLICFNPSAYLCARLMDASSPYSYQATEILFIFFSQLKDLPQKKKLNLFSHKMTKLLFGKLFSIFTTKQFKDQRRLKSKVKQESENPDAVEKKRILSDDTDVTVEYSKLYTLLFLYLENWSDVYNANMELKELSSVLTSMKILLECNIYPKRWMSMYLKNASICAGVLSKSSSYILTNGDLFFNQLIRSYSEAFYSFILLNCLQLQHLPLSKSQKIIDDYGDMRIDVMESFYLVWKQQSSKSLLDKSFITQTTMKILSVGFLSAKSIRKKAIELLLNMIENWISKCENIVEVQSGIISETENILRNGFCDEDYLECFFSVVENEKPDPNVSSVVESLTNLISLHLEKRSFARSSLGVLHSQFLLYSLMKFYLEEVHIFCHYSYYSNKLSELMEAEEYYFEAALILKDQFDFINSKDKNKDFDVVFFENFHGISNEAEKNQIIKTILDLLNQTKEYEYAADFSKEIYKLYLTSYKYNDLSSLLIQWSNYYELIMTEPRLTLNYYRVTFIGGILPKYMKNQRDFIIKGSMWFQLNSLKALLSEAYPDSEIRSYQSSSPVESPYEQKMVIYIAKMEPVPLDMKFANNRSVSTKIRNFFKDHRVTTFVSDHPFHKGKVDKENEIKTLHISRVTVITEIMMPNMFMWNPIINETRECLTPIEVAIDAILKKNQTFRDAIDEYLEDPSKDLRPFTMLLSGTLDAGVNGGMAKYMEAFFDENYTEEISFGIDYFIQVLNEQKHVLNEAMDIHKRLVSLQFQPMHERLEECFGILSKTVMELNGCRQHSFSSIHNINDIYMETSQLSFDNPVTERDYDFFSNDRSMCQKQYSFVSKISNRSSENTSVSARTTSGSSIITNRSRLVSNKSLRKISSTDEEMIAAVVKEYEYKMDNLNFPTLTPSISTPDIRFQTNRSMAEESKVSPLISPPLPPSNDECVNQTTKSKSRLNWIKWTLRSRKGGLSLGNGPTNSADSIHKTKMSVIEMFKGVDNNKFS